MSKKYHLDQNEVAYLHCLNGAFAGLYILLENLKVSGKKIPKKKLIELMQDTLARTNTAVASEFIRGELIKKGVLENGDDTALCVFDPSEDNENSVTEVFTNDELKNIRLEKQEPTWKNSVKGS